MRCIRCNSQMKGIFCECGLSLKMPSCQFISELGTEECLELTKFIHNASQRMYEEKREEMSAKKKEDAEMESRVKEDQKLMEEFEKVYLDSKAIAEMVYATAYVLIDTMKTTVDYSTLWDTYQVCLNSYKTNGLRAVADAVGKSNDIKPKLYSDELKKKIDKELDAILKNKKDTENLLNQYEESVKKQQKSREEYEKAKKARYEIGEKNRIERQKQEKKKAEDKTSGVGNTATMNTSSVSSVYPKNEDAKRAEVRRRMEEIKQQDMTRPSTQETTTGKPKLNFKFW